MPNANDRIKLYTVYMLSITMISMQLTPSIARIGEPVKKICRYILQYVDTCMHLEDLVRSTTGADL